MRNDAHLAPAPADERTLSLPHMFDPGRAVCPTGEIQRLLVRNLTRARAKEA